MQLLNHDIPMPRQDPPTWAGMVEDCLQCVRQVRKELYDGEDPSIAFAVDQVFAADLISQLWQDMRVQVMEHDRLYVPADIAKRNELDLGLMRKALSVDTDRGCDGTARDGSCDCANMPGAAMRLVVPAYQQTMRELVKRTELLLLEGWEGARKLPGDKRQMLRRVVVETRARLGLIAQRGYDTMSRRPEMGGLMRGWWRLRGRFM